ncbi:MAG: hypothetical protein AAF961_18140 [Planctomycetota bacterium]
MVVSQKNRRIFCQVLCIDKSSSSDSANPSRRPSQLLPWADPYIAGLVTQLQAEVRRERSTGDRKSPSRWETSSHPQHHATSRRGVFCLAGELEPPTSESGSDAFDDSQHRWPPLSGPRRPDR